MWYSRFSTGDEAIDEQHRHIDECLSVIPAGSADAADYVITAIEALKVHLQSEEKLSSERSYDMTEAHKAMHDEIRERLDDVEDLVRKGEIKLESVISELKGLVSLHVMKYDSELVPRAAVGAPSTGATTCDTTS